MINLEQLKEDIIWPALHSVNLFSEEAVDLLVGTCCQESLLGTYVTQVGSGNAMGIYQMEERTYDDIVENFIFFRKDLYKDIINSLDYLIFPDADCLIYNMRLSTIMARVHYLRVKEPIPAVGDVEAMAAYWKKYYNTELGKGKESDFVDNYNKFCLIK